ncbi:MAG: hypothetical protein ABFS35_00595 [Bacteroidota bacterium]
MAKITMAIQFDRLDDVIHKNDRSQFDVTNQNNHQTGVKRISKEDESKISEINKIIIEIEEKFEVKCDKYYLGNNIIESFFDVYYASSGESGSSEIKLKEIYSFLSFLRNKYLKVNIQWCVLDPSNNSDDFV